MDHVVARQRQRGRVARGEGCSVGDRIAEALAVPALEMEVAGRILDAVVPP